VINVKDLAVSERQTNRYVSYSTLPCLLSLLFLLLLAFPTFAATYYVAPDGSGTTCSSGAPCVSIPAVITAKGSLAANDIVNVQPGTYPGGWTTEQNGTAGNLIVYRCFDFRIANAIAPGACKLVPAPNGTTTFAWQNGGTAGSPPTGSYVQITGFEIDGSNFQGGTKWTDGLDVGGNGVVVDHMDIHHILLNNPCNTTGGAGLEADSFWGGGDSVTFTQNTIHDIGPLSCPNLIHGIYIMSSNDVVTNNLIYSTAGLCVDSWHNQTDSIVANNTLFNCTGGGIAMGTGQWYAAKSGGARSTTGAGSGSTLTFATGTNTTYTNAGCGAGGTCGVYDVTNSAHLGNNCLINSHTDTTFVLSCSATGVTGVESISFGPIAANNKVFNNIVRNGVGAKGWAFETFGALDTSTLSIDKNLTYQNAQADDLLAGGSVTNSITSDPKMIDFNIYGGGNYRLLTGSPAIGVGSSVAGVPSVDFDGNPRPTGGTYDIGAFEFFPSPYPATSPVNIQGPLATAATQPYMLWLNGYPKTSDVGSCLRFTNPIASNMVAGASTPTYPTDKFICVDNNGDLTVYNNSYLRLMKFYETGSMAIGSQANPHGNLGATCQSNVGLPTSGGAGIVQSCRYTLAGTTSGTTAVRLTADGLAATGNNCVNMPSNSSGNYSVQLVASLIWDTTAIAPLRGNDYGWTLSNGYYRRDVAASTMAVTNGTPVAVDVRHTQVVVTGQAVALTADTTNACFNLTFTPPSANAAKNVWNVGAYIDIIESPPQ